MSSDYRDDISLAFTGASGAQYGLRLLDCLLQADRRVHLMLSKPAQVVIGTETDVKLPGRHADMARFLAERSGVTEERLRVYGQDEWTSALASGSGAPRTMVVCPCTTATVSNIAMGASRSLIERAADVVLKERHRLVLVIRETPFSEIHLENMLRLARMGAIILPANPGFYHRPDSVEALVDFVVARTLDHLGVEHDLMARWGR
ncbi:flavin prenyltransferase UbiX [Natronospira bacteriovora]|uniref:Flavin prenyltransferase UbiX n=1 Tax=Natronospira bacteriovora TaxID=3069753 RepID=A0ABU0W6F4_9GAMM|nr:flavin prenyltransferase UbiX [Natronospira sp. AB-CW4]MDQ2069576.1 flavin prenyltransferase UbiX [Natronospira sp. AB-CW4]